MSKRAHKDGQMTFLLPINTQKTDRTDQRTIAAGTTNAARSVSYGSVLDSLKKKGLTGPKK